MTLPPTPTPSALSTGTPIRADLLEIERGALLQVAARFRGRDLIEMADALGLCGPRPAGFGYLPASSGNPTFGSTTSPKR